MSFLVKHSNMEIVFIGNERLGRGAGQLADDLG